MADEITPVEETQDSGSELAERIQKMATSVEESNEKVTSLTKKIEELEKARTNTDEPNAMQGFNIRQGEDPMTSRPYSVMAVAKRLAMQKSGGMDYREYAKPEAELSDELRKHYCGGAQWQGFDGSFVIPLSASCLPMDDRTTDEGETIPAVPRELVQKCKHMMHLSNAWDPDEISWLENKSGVRIPLNKTGMSIQKDMSANTATTGGTFVAEAAQGELINVLSAMSVMDQVGAQQMDLPPQGSISFPRVTTAVTVAAQSEGATIAESTPATGALRLQAKPYSGLTDVPEELFKFASLNVEQWLRGEFMRELALKIDRDSINGAGGIAIQGVINYSGFTTRVATTTTADGNTIVAADPMLLQGEMSDDNVNVDDPTFFFAMRGSLWSFHATRATSSPFMFSSTFNTLSDAGGSKGMNGVKVITSSQIPNDRVKGTGTTLTLVLAGVGREWISARAGVVDVAMTNFGRK